MIEYNTISVDVDGFNPTARRIRLETPVVVEEHGEVEEAVLVMSESSLNSNWALFVDDEWFIEGYTQKSLFWRLAEISENLEIRVNEKKK